MSFAEEVGCWLFAEPLAKVGWEPKPEGCGWLLLLSNLDGWPKLLLLFPLIGAWEVGCPKGICAVANPLFG